MPFDIGVAAEKPVSIRQVWLDLAKEPKLFLTHWNYKGAILSSIFRAPVFLITYLAARESLKLALAAASVQFVFRFFFAGLTGYFIQSFRRVEPPWKAAFSILMVVPLISHVIEYFVQAGFVYATATTDYTEMAIVRSVCFSIFSSLFALFIMRRNVMIVGDPESRSLFSDLKKFPALVFEFMAFIPREIAALVRRHRFVLALILIAAWGLFSQLVCLAVTNRNIWTYGGGKDLGILKYWGVDGIIMMLIAVAFSLLPFNFVRRDADHKNNA